MFKDDNLNENDPLSVSLMKMKLKAFANVALDAGGAWAIEFPAQDWFTFSFVQKGECFLSIDGKEHHAGTGDCILITGKMPYVLAKDLSIKRKTSVQKLFGTAKDGITTVNGGGDFLSLGTLFAFEGHLPKIIFGRLPPVIHVPADSDQAAVMRWTLERFSAEFRGNNVGRSLMINHLAPVLFLQTLRVYLGSAQKREKNWLVALSDPKLSMVISAMHADYQRRWSLDDLAKVAGMSRSGFALMFKKQIGIAPMDYLTNWRIQIACEYLQMGESISSVAKAVGYESESAFSVAFKKILNLRPGAYQKLFQDTAQAKVIS